MALILTSLYRMYSYAMTELPDPRNAHLPFINNVAWPLSIVGVYVYFALYWGPKWMKNRKPFRIEQLMSLYNLIQVIYCVYIFVEGLRTVILVYDWRCAPVDYSLDPVAVKVAFLTWSYFIIKIVDLIDTVFFILRKKEQHVSFLHVYHHAGMVAISWVAAKFLPGGHVIYVGFINCFVHAIMYSYYLISTHYKQNLWFKKHITQLQILQFASFTFLYGQLFFRKNCNFPWHTQAVFFPQNLFMMCLFLDFYYKAYIKKKPTLTEETSSSSTSSPSISSSNAQINESANSKAVKVE